MSDSARTSASSKQTSRLQHFAMGPRGACGRSPRPMRFLRVPPGPWSISGWQPPQGTARRVGSYVALNAENYRASPPTGTFWDPVIKSILSPDKRPKGRAGSRFAKVFRTDWEDGKAFYHPYDGHAARTHPNWVTKLPHLLWTEEHTIVDYLVEFQSLLISSDYVGL